jgi:DUF4097 and DUF4098 domain-containing protein YvlB
MNKILKLFLLSLVFSGSSIAVSLKSGQGTSSDGSAPAAAAAAAPGAAAAAARDERASESGTSQPVGNRLERNIDPAHAPLTGRSQIFVDFQVPGNIEIVSGPQPRITLVNNGRRDLPYQLIQEAGSFGIRVQQPEQASMTQVTRTQTTVIVDWFGSTTVIGAPGTPGTIGGQDNATLQLVLPSNAAQTVTVRTASADLRVTNVSGALTVLGSSADIDVTGQRGSVTVSSSSGSINVNGTNGNIVLQTASGDVTAEDNTGSESIRITTASGDVTASRNEGSIQATTVSGDVRASRNAGFIRATTVSGDVRVDRNAGSDVHTTSGDIEIRHQSPETTTAHTRTGHVSGPHQVRYSSRDFSYSDSSRIQSTTFAANIDRAFSRVAGISGTLPTRTGGSAVNPQTNARAPEPSWLRRNGVRVALAAGFILAALSLGSPWQASKISGGTLKGG